MILAALLCVTAPQVSVRVEGEGWLRFLRDGRAVYAREARLVASGGRLATEAGLVLSPEVLTSSPDFTVSSDGTVQAGGVQAGRIMLAHFAAPPILGEDGLARSAGRPELRAAAAGSLVVGGVAAGPGQAPSPATAPARPAGGLRVRPSVAVVGPQVLLGDLVDGLGDGPLSQVPFGPAPVVGAVQTIDSVRVDARIRASGLAPAGFEGLGRGQIRVERASQILGADALAAAGLPALEREHGAGWQPVPGQQEYAAPVGQVELRPERTSVSGRVATVVVAVYVDGVRHNSRTVRYQRAAATLPARGTNVAVRVIAGAVVVEARGVVASVDAGTGSVTVKIAETQAVMTGTVAADGAVEVRR